MVKFTVSPLTPEHRNRGSPRRSPLNRLKVRLRCPPSGPRNVVLSRRTPLNLERTRERACACACGLSRCRRWPDAHSLTHCSPSGAGATPRHHITGHHHAFMLNNHDQGLTVSLRQERAQTSIWGMLSNTVCARPPTQQPPHASNASRPARLPARSSRRGSFARPPIPPSLPWCIDLGSSGTGGGPRAAGPRSSRLALVAARVPCEGPHGEDITVLRVRDAARAVEDASDALLLPVAILALLRH